MSPGDDTPGLDSVGTILVLSGPYAGGAGGGGDGSGGGGGETGP